MQLHPVPIRNQPIAHDATLPQPNATNRGREPAAAGGKPARAQGFELPHSLTPERARQEALEELEDEAEGLAAEARGFRVVARDTIAAVLTEMYGVREGDGYRYRGVLAPQHCISAIQAATELAFGQVRDGQIT